MRITTLPIALLVLAAGCGGPPPEPPQPEAPAATGEAPPDAPTDEPAAEQADESWVLAPSSIRFDGDSKTIFVQAALERTDGGAARTEPVHVGVTVVTTDGEEIDLMVQTLFPGNFDAPILFSAGVEAQVQDVLIGAWNERVEPCEVDRYGCREFGFVLDGSLASWPPGLYTEGMRQRIPPGEVLVRVLGEPAIAGPVSEDARKRLQADVAMFGSKAVAEAVPGGSSSPTKAVIVHEHPNDRLLARGIAEVLPSGVEPVIEQGPAQGATVLVRLE